MAPLQSNTVPRFTPQVACPPCLAMAVTHSMGSDWDPPGWAPSMMHR